MNLLKKTIIFLQYIGLFNFMSDELYLKLMYRVYLGKKLNLDNPQTFNEKIQWLKLNDKNPEYIKMVDKYDVKKYVSNIIGEEYIIPTLGIYNKFDEIDFEKLPDQFVIKCTHDSGGVVICKDKNIFNVKKAKRKINKALKKNFFYVGREWPYKNIKPRIIVEKYIEDPDKVVPEDYKVYCFNGKPKFIVVFHNRFNESKELSETVYDTNWQPQHVSFSERFLVSNIVEPKPECLDKLLNFAEKLSKGIAQSRIDFYIVGGHIYFGEITLYTASGFKKMRPETLDAQLGEFINLKSCEEKRKKSE